MHANRIVIAAALASAVLLNACATGSSIVTGTTRAPVAPENVRLYLEPPATFETIGLVSASSDAGFTEQKSVDYALAELKKQAGKLGANGVLLVATGETTSTYVGGSGGNVYSIPIVAKTVQGRAIFVAEK